MKIHCAYDELINLSSLKQHPKNRNKHSKEQIERLCKILEYQGWRYPIKVSKRSGYITSGHGRLMAAMKLGLSQVPISRQDYEDETQEYADIQSDNAIASWSELDLSGINLDIQDLGPDFDIDLLGIKGFEIDVADRGQCDEDEIPEHVEPKTKLGDIYTLGNHRLLCGDSTDILCVEKLMNGEKADMVFTDPPYELETKGGGLFQESRAMKAIKTLGIDKFDPSILISHADTSIFCCNKPLVPKYIKLADDWGVSWDIAVYHKQNITPNYGGHLMTDLEYLMVVGKQSPRTGLGEDKELYSKLFSGGKDQDNETAWSKPVALCEKFIKLYSEKRVIDLFGGSGSTLIACEKTNRKCFMMELDPHYCDVIVARWEKYTGKKAELTNG
jgi:16S rRNA G966 N2-methylase RsmD